MSIKLMSMVFDAEGFSSTEKLVLLALADHANDEGRHVYPSVARLGRKCALTERGIRLILSKFRIEGVLIVIQPGGGTIATEYQINVRKLMSMIPTPERSSPLPLNDVHPPPESHSAQSSYNHQDNPLSPDGDGGAEVVEDKLPPPDPLAPDTPGAEYMFVELGKNASARGRRGAKRFETIQQKEAFVAAEGRIGIGEIKAAIMKGLQSGVTDRARMVAWVVKWTPGAFPGRSGNGHNHEQAQSLLKGL